MHMAYLAVDNANYKNGGITLHSKIDFKPSTLLSTSNAQLLTYEAAAPKLMTHELL